MKKYKQRFDIFFGQFSLFTNKKQSGAHKKNVKTLMEVFCKIKFLTDNAVNYDVTFGVVLSTWSLKKGEKLQMSFESWSSFPLKGFN